jgi:two-component system, OmpR family, heavy metal sensor histidine kinase CusS
MKASKAKRAWSITNKLIFLYTLSAAVILFLASGFLYWALVNNFEMDNTRLLVDKITIMRVILQDQPDISTLQQDLEWEGAGLALRQSYYIRVLEQGAILLESHDMDKMIPTSVFPAPKAAKEMPGEGVRWRSPDGHTYMLMAAWSDPDPFTGKIRLIQVALDETDDVTLIAKYRRNLVLALVLGIMFSALTGVAVARKGMRPLEEITEAASSITATQLHKRISAGPWPRELQDLANAFDQMLTRLEDSFIRLSQFSADLAHELRTPINNLVGEAEVALARVRSLEEYQQVLESSLEEYGRLSRMIDSLLFLARAENEQARLPLSCLNAHDEIQAVIEFFETLAEEQGVQVVSHGEASLAADPILFRRTMSNLLANALRYTPRGGSVTFSVAAQPDRSVRILVEDTGSGIAEEHLPRIFDRFYRADHARSNHPSGSGLGLAIVKSIMNLHGGSIHIHSTVGEGTTVELDFPPSDCG